MSAATATLRINPIQPALAALDEATTSNTAPAEIAACLLSAACAVVPCSGGALLLLGTSSPEKFAVVATSVPKKYSLGQHLKGPIRPPRGALAVSIRAAGAEFGRILLLDAKAPHGEKQQLLERVTTLGAILHPLTQAETLRRRLIDTNAIVEVGQVLTGLLTVDEVLSYVVQLAESLVEGSCATIALLSPNDRELVLRTSTGTLRGAEGQVVTVDGSLMGWVVQHGKPLVTPNVATDPRTYLLRKQPPGPGLVVPIQLNGETIGAFLVGRLEKASPFTDENVQTLQQVSAYAAIAIHNARLYREQMDTADTLRQQTTRLQEAYSELNRQQEQLIVSEKMAALGRVTAGIAHEINSPLGGILNSLHTARGYAQEYHASASDPEITASDHRLIADDILSALALAEKAASKVAQFVRSIKTQTRPGEGRMTMFDPGEEIDATVALLQHRLKSENIGVYTELERGLSLTGDQGKFGLVIQNLVVNAIDAYEGAGGEVWVRVRGREDSVLVEVEDRGCGIPDQIRASIFDYLFTTKDVGKGTGLGLAMVHSVVTGDFGGSIELETRVGRGTIFKLVLPLTRTTT